MSVGEFTASNIHLDEDKREEELSKKKALVDMVKLNADIAALFDLGSKVGRHRLKDLFVYPHIAHRTCAWISCDRYLTEYWYRYCDRASFMRLLRGC